MPEISRCIMAHHGDLIQGLALPRTWVKTVSLGRVRGGIREPGNCSETWAAWNHLPQSQKHGGCHHGNLYLPPDTDLFGCVVESEKAKTLLIAQNNNSWGFSNSLIANHLFQNLSSVKPLPRPRPFPLRSPISFDIRTDVS